LPKTIKTILPCTFYDCNNLIDVILPESLERIEEEAFSLCKFNNITLPNNLRYIGVSAFAGCEFLEKINFPQGLESIDNEAFNCCYSLTSIQLPSSVNIGKDAFRKCSKLLRAIDNPKFASIGSQDLFLLKVETSPSNTTLYFKCINPLPAENYTYWATINPQTYLEADGVKYQLKYANGIEIAPEKTYYKQKELFFELSFPGLPVNVSTFDFVEDPNGDWVIKGVCL